MSRLSRCWLRDLVFLVLFISENENAGGSAICIHRDLLPEEAIVTHLITCQGRDHIVSIRSGRHNLGFVNFHFELELTLRQLRDKLHLIRPHWPSYSNGVGVILGDVNICDPEPDIHRWWPEKDCHVPLIFHMFLTLPSLITRGGTPQSLESYAPCRELIVFFSFYLWLKHVICTVPLMFSRTWEIVPFRV